MLNANKDYKGLPARSRRKAQTHCHLRGNFPSLGEEQETKKGTEPSADATARLLGMREATPDLTGPAGRSPRKPSSSVSSTEDHVGGRAGGQRPPHRLPESNLVAGGDDTKNSRQTWRQRHGQASPSPFRLGDIVEAGPHGPNALLLVPLKQWDGAHALSSFLPPLASILLASKPKKARPLHLGAGHERRKKTLQDLGNARRKAGSLERKRSPTTPIYNCVGRQASGLSKGEGLGIP